jgi:hypothetical protein
MGHLENADRFLNSQIMVSTASRSTYAASAPLREIAAKPTTFF